MGSAATFYRGVQQDQIQHDRDLQDQQRKTQIGQYDAVKSNIEGILQSGVDPHTQQPLSDDQRTHLSNAHAIVLKHQSDLYNPRFDPAKGEVPEDPLHKLTTTVGLTADTHPAPGQQLADLNDILAKYGQPAEVNPLLKSARQMKEAGLTPEEIKKSQRVGAGVEAKPINLRGQWKQITGKFSDGSPATLLQNAVDGSVTDLNGEDVAPEKLSGFVITPKPALPKQAWGKDAKGYFSVNLDRLTNQEIPGTRNYGQTPPASVAGRVSTGFFHYWDPADGMVHQVAETRTSMPGGGAAAASATISATPNSSAAPIGNKVIGYKGTKDMVETKGALQGALDRQDTMHQNYLDALNGDQQAMLSLVANHIGMTLSAQKGARINQAVWNEAIKSAPWFDSTAAKFFHQDQNGDYIFDGWKGGVTLTKDQMGQMVRLADDKVATIQKHLQRLRDIQEGKNSGGEKQRRSLKQAMALPAMKGKTEQEVRGLLEQHGYEVAP